MIQEAEEPLLLPAQPVAQPVTLDRTIVGNRPLRRVAAHTLQLEQVTAVLAFAPIEVDVEVVASASRHFLKFLCPFRTRFDDQPIGQFIERGVAEHHGEAAEEDGIELALRDGNGQRLAILDRLEAAAPDRGRCRTAAQRLGEQINGTLIVPTYAKVECVGPSF